MTAIERFREAYMHRDQAAREWRAQGGRVVGYLCDNLPEELVIAAGFLPYRLSGDPHAARGAIEQYVQPFAAPFSARNRGVGFTDAMLEMLLAGEYDFLDYLVVPHTRKAIQAYYRELTLAKQRHPELQLPELFFLDRAYTPFYAAEVFNREQLLSFKAQVETWAGAPIDPSALADAVALAEDHKGLLRRVLELRAADPPALSGTDALAIVGTSQWMPRSQHAEWLRQLLAEPTETLSEDSVRLFVGGSPLDHPQLYEIIESCGAVVVGEDHCWGSRCAEFPLDGMLDPFEALADRYHRKPACSIGFPLGSVVERCSRRAVDSGAEGAVFFVYQGDGVHIWDTPDELRAIEEQGIPSLYLSQQPYWIDDVEPIRARVAEFVDNVRAQRGAAV